MLPLIVIGGPTASGKTQLAIELARALDGEILSADSQQLYRGLDIGTAKPTLEEQAQIPHHLLDLVDPCAPGAYMDAARWSALADAAIETIASRGKLPIAVGGTGLYLRALLHGVAEGPGRDDTLRAELTAMAEREGRPAVHARLAGVDPEAARRIRQNDLVRIIRALEMAGGGTTQTALFASHAFAPDRYRALLFAPDWPREVLHQRIDERVQRMFEGGMLAEARAMEGNVQLRRLPIGYAEALAVLAGDLSKEEAIRRVQITTHRYARRQIVWLRKEPGIEWLPTPPDARALADRIARWRSMG